MGFQLLLTFAVVVLFSANTSVRNYVDMDNGGHQWPFVLAVITALSCVITLTCCTNQARVYPNNYLFLGLFTAAESVLLGTATAAYELTAIMLAVGVTASLCLGLIAFAKTTKRDFTGAGPFLFTALWILIVFGLVLSFMPGMAQDAQTAYALLGVVIFSFYVVYDVQLILGGKHNRFRYSVDDYVIVALMLYLDVINIFVDLLQLIGGRRD